MHLQDQRLHSGPGHPLRLHAFCRQPGWGSSPRHLLHLQFGDLDFITDKFGKPRLRDAAPCQSTESALPTSSTGQGSHLVAMVDSVPDVLNADSDVSGSLGSYDPSREVFIAGAGTEAASGDGVLMTPITTSTSERLSSSR